MNNQYQVLWPAKLVTPTKNMEEKLGGIHIILILLTIFKKQKTKYYGRNYTG
jgi:hypothetical protein